jgi:hypothetical protein
VSYRRPRFPEDHYLRLPNAWARDGQLKPNAKAILMSILSHDPEWELSTAQLMRETGLGRDAIQAATRHMLDRGYLTEVSQGRDDSTGKWGGNDYVVTDCVGIPPPPPPTADPDLFGGNLRIDPQRVDPFPVEPGTVNPASKKTPGEKTTPVPSGQGAEGRHLAPVPVEEGPTVNQRAQVLATEHYEGVGKLVPFMGIRSIVAAALAAGHGDEQVRAALGHLRRTNRTLTKNALGLLLAAPQNGRNVSNGGYGPRGFAPYRNPDPADPANAHAFEGPL